MADLQMNGNYDSYLSQLFNPQAGGGQGLFGQGVGNPMIGAGGLASLLQTPQLGQGIGAQGIGSQIWPQQQQQQHQQIHQTLAAVQLAQQIVARHAVQAIQCAQALQTLQQAIHNQAQQAVGLQGQVGAFGQTGQGLGQFNSWGMQNPFNPGQQPQQQQQQALQQLSPLVSHLDQSPEEKFRTTMMMIQASDNQDLLQAAYDAANQITDEKAKAQALLDVINEINYFSQK